MENRQVKVKLNNVFFCLRIGLFVLLYNICAERRKRLYIISMTAMITSFLACT